MQREQLSIPKNIIYIVLAVLYFALQSSIGRFIDLRGFRIDLLPCFVAAAALLDGPIEGAVMGVTVGILYDVGFIGIDGIYPIFFMIFGLFAGALSRLALSRNYISMLLLTAAEMLLLGLGRYFTYLLPAGGASFMLVLQQVVGGALLSGVLSFIVYVPLRKISHAFEGR